MYLQHLLRTARVSERVLHRDLRRGPNGCRVCSRIVLFPADAIAPRLELSLLYDRGMTKAASRRSTISKPTSAPKSVDEYFAGLKGPARDALNKMRATIRSVVPVDATEVISYGIPAFKQRKVLVWYAGFANHCSLFPTAAVIGEMKDELEGFTISKGTIQFPLDKPLPTALIKKVVKRRMANLD